MKRLLIPVALCLFATWATADEPDTIIFPHDLHFEAEVECLLCHEGVDESATPADTHFPEMDVCGDCHDIDSEDNCALCHSNVDEAGDYHRRQYKALFPHAPHVTAEMKCAACHGDPALPRPAYPGKPDCRVCHDTADDYAGCAMCHTADMPLRPADHDQAWINLHGAEARFDQASCAACHSETTCQECHGGDNVRPRSHELNYEFNHALDARGKEMECATCHSDPDYCASCHAAQRIYPTDHSQTGWVNMTDGGRHATEGLFDIESCIACHSAGAQEPSCAQCHGR
jgi:hypothetical protein